MAIKEILEQTSASTSFSVDGHEIGRATLNPFTSIGSSFHDKEVLINALLGDDSMRMGFAVQMHNNSPSHRNGYCVERGHSAYYTFDLKTGEVIIEWGEIGSDSEAKLHNYMRKAIDYGDRVKQKMIVRSGHMAQVEDSGEVICLIDSLADKPVGRTLPEFEIVKVLQLNGFLVIGSDGSPVVLQEEESDF